MLTTVSQQLMSWNFSSTLNAISNTAVTAAQDIVRKLNLEPHPEGGFYREIFRDGAMSSIYYLLTVENCFSALHRVNKSVEIWAFHEGDTVELVVENELGHLVQQKLGTVGDNVSPQVIVHPHHVQGARFLPGGSNGYALVGCIVAPPFLLENFEMPTNPELLSEFQEEREIVDMLTR